MFCSRCRYKNSRSDKFCANCGTSLSESTELSLEIKEAEIQIKKGVGGWLILVAIGVFLAPPLIAYSIFDNLSLLNEFGPAYLNSIAWGFGEAVIVESVLDIAFLFFSLFILVLFIKKKKVFPKYFILYLGVSMGYSVLSFMTLNSLTATTPEFQEIFESTLEETFTPLVRTILFSSIWIVYMLKSNRVKNTFIE